MHGHSLRTLSSLLALLLILLTGCASSVSAPTPAAGPGALPTTAAPPPDTQRFAGVTINVLTHDGPQIAEPLKRRAPEFQALTGATVNVSTVPFDQLYQELMADFRNGTRKYDVAVFGPQWMVDYASNGYLEDLSARVKTDSAMVWDDIAPFFRDFSAAYNGHIYTVPLDGDFQMVYYRSDLLQQDGLTPPNTWQDYLAIARHFSGKDLNGDGTPDFGSCIATQEHDQAYHMVWSVAGAFLQTQGTQQGAFFDPDTMTPLVKNEAMATTLDILKEAASYGSPDPAQHSLHETRGLFLSGRCALTLDWGDIGTLAIDPQASHVVDKVGALVLPGSSQVLDRTTGKLVACTKTVCPYAVEGVNHAPYAAFGGWSGAINAASDPAKKDAGYAFLSYMSQAAQSNTDVTIGATGFNPYRTSQFTQRDAWLAAGMSAEASSKYLGAISVSLSSANVVLDLRIPQNQRYQEVVLDSALAQFLAGTMTKEQTLQYIADGWDTLTTEVGRETQRKAYRASLGIDN